MHPLEDRGAGNKKNARHKSDPMFHIVHAQKHQNRPGWSSDVRALLQSGRITASQLKKDIRFLCERMRPVLLCADGYPLVEDAGGEVGYCDLLRRINGETTDSDDPVEDKNDAAVCLNWAKSLGWKQQVPERSLL